jgi:hypothetical protein
MAVGSECNAEAPIAKTLGQCTVADDEERRPVSFDTGFIFASKK